MPHFLAFFLVQINIFKHKGVKIDLNIKFNVSSKFNSDINNQEAFIKLFNAKLLKIIMHLELYAGANGGTD